MALFTPILKYVWKENAKLDAARIRLQTPTAGVDCVCNIPYINDKTAEHMLDVYFPENSNERLPVIIDIHGGGWMSGSKEINKNFCTNIAVKGFCVFSINYRLAGKHKFNEQIEDIFEAFERAGGPDRETAGKFRKTILEKGYAVPPMRQFMDFMGRKPRMDAMLRKRRLAS